MGMSDRIEAFILELMRQEQQDWITIQRNEMAQLFGCVPSQINYVISTRFTPERGYAVQSRRGGGGCVKIRRTESEELIDQRNADEYIKKLSDVGYITRREAAIIKAAAAAAENDKARYRIMKEIMEAIIR